MDPPSVSEGVSIGHSCNVTRNEAKPAGERLKRSVSKQIYFGLLTNYSNIAPSMSLGYSAIALPALTDKSNSSYLSSDESSWFAAIASLATPFGCVCSGPICDRFGRKPALCLVNCVGFLGWLTIAAAFYRPDDQRYAVLLLGRFLTGLSTGLASMPATIYMAETASPKWRGVFCTWSTISFAVGILAVYFLGFVFKDNWSAIALITAAFPIFGLGLTVFLIPESPSWLVGKNKVERAKKNLCQIFGVKTFTAEVQNELEAMISTRADGALPKPRKPLLEQFKNKVKHLVQPTCLNPFALVAMFFFFQQFSGIYAVVFYAISIVEGAGIRSDPYVTIVVIGVVRLLSAMLLSCVCKIFSRRALSICSGVGMAATMGALGAYLLLLDRDAIPSTNAIPILLLLLYFITSSLGFLPLPFAMAAEVFPAKVRGTASGLLVALAYFFNFITVKIFPSMVDGIGTQGVFFFYGGMAVVGVLFVIFLLPETKGKSLKEIEQYFSRKRNSLMADASA